MRMYVACTTPEARRRFLATGRVTPDGVEQAVIVLESPEYADGTYHMLAVEVPDDARIGTEIGPRAAVVDSRDVTPVEALDA